VYARRSESRSGVREEERLKRQERGRGLLWADSDCVRGSLSWTVLVVRRCIYVTVLDCLGCVLTVLEARNPTTRRVVVG
jgi:hypothetical protein